MIRLHCTAFSRSLPVLVDQARLAQCIVDLAQSAVTLGLPAVLPCISCPIHEFDFLYGHLIYPFKYEMSRNKESD